MFKIKFRIVDDIQLLSTIQTKIFDDEYDQILGFFQISFGAHQEGVYYHENQLKEDEEGSELLDYWFDKILLVAILLDSESDYVAFKEIETVNRWIDFTKRDNNVVINVAVDDICQNNNLIITEKYQFSHIEPLNYVMPYQDLKCQILEVSEKFLTELNQINPNLCKTKICKALQQKIDIIKIKS